MWPVAPPFQLIPRSVLWPGQVPRSSSGSLRSQVKRPADFLTGHYTGSPGEWADFDDTHTEAAALQVYAQHASKPWEYNWIVDTQGQVVEYAGTYQAAHSAGENGVSHGVLFFLGVGEPMTSQMILAFRQLRWWLTECGYLAPVGPTPHNQMPGAATLCPGPKVEEHWAALSTPWTPAGGNDVELIIQPPWRRDTRTEQKLPANSATRVAVPGLPPGCRAVQMTFTPVEPEAAGHFTVWAGGERPNSSFANVRAGDYPDGRTLTVPLDAYGGFQFYTSVRTHVLFDYTGLAYR